MVWSGAEGGKMLLDGNVEWGKNHAATWGLTAVAVDGDVVFATDGKRLTRVTRADGSDLPWGTDADLFLGKLRPGSHADAVAQGLAARGGKVYLSYAKEDAVLVVDAKSGKLEKTLKVERPDGLYAAGDDLLYVVSGGKSVVAVNPAIGEAKPLIGGLANATGIATDKAGKIYVAVGVPENQVKVFTADGRPTSTAIGHPGGRSTVGPWTPEGMAFVKGVAVDAQGKVWAAEGDQFPRRVSVWDGRSGKLVRDFFGPTPYGATGGAILRSDPNVIIGSGCEWRMDPATGKSKIVAVITRDGMGQREVRDRRRRQGLPGRGQ